MNVFLSKLSSFNKVIEEDELNGYEGCFIISDETRGTINEK